MTQRSRLAVLGLSLIITIASVALASAQAESTPQWMISAVTELGPSLPVEVEAKAKEALTLLSKVGAITVKISCEGLALDKALFEGEGKSSGTALFSSCQTYLNGSGTPNKACHPTEPVAAKVKGQLVTHEGATLERLEPAEGSVFAKLKFEASCSLGTSADVTGVLYLKEAGGNFEVPEEAHVFEEGPLSALKFAGQAATLDGSASVSMIGKHLHRTWSGLGSTSQWMISAVAELSPSLPVEVEAKAKEALTLLSKVGIITVKISCEGLALDKALFEGEGKSSGTALFSSCQTYLNGSGTPNKACHPTEPVAAKVKGQLVTHEGATLERLEPTEGSLFSKLKFEPSCALGSSADVTGVLYLKEAGGNFEVPEEAHVFEEGPLSALKFAGQAATLDGSASVSMIGKHLHRTWSGLGSTSQWMISAVAELSPSLPVEVEAKAKEALTLLSKVGIITVKISCEGLALDKALFEGEGKSSGTALFSSCQTYLNGSGTPNKACHPTEPVAAKVKGQLVTHEGATLERLEPTEGSLFSKLKFEPSCALGSSADVTGVLYLKEAGGNFEVPEEAHVFEEGPLSALKFAGQAATLDGSVSVSMIGKHLHRTWSGLG